MNDGSSEHDKNNGMTALHPSIDDVSNRAFIHPISNGLLPLALRLGITANAISVSGLVLGFLAALAYSRWMEPQWALLGFLLMIGWHVCDGLDGRIARATNSASETGRLLDGLCDYMTFILVYLVLGATLPWDEPLISYAAMVVAGGAHIVQSALYEGERARFFRRAQGQPPLPWEPTRFGGVIESIYAAMATSGGTTARAVDAALAEPGAEALRQRYVQRAVPWMRFNTLLSANGRTLAIFLACLADRPALFWWWTIIGLTMVMLVGRAGLRHIDRALLPR